MHRWRFLFELTEEAFVKVISGICSFWQAKSPASNVAKKFIGRNDCGHHHN
jgi:hypothetical protein